MIGFALTWVVFGLVLALFGARAWVVETNRGRFTTGGAAERGLTAAVAGAVALLIVLAVANGGFELIGLLVNGEAQTATPADGGQVNPAAPAAGSPGADPLAPGVQLPAAPNP